MNSDRRVLDKLVGGALSGKGAHVGTGDVVAGLHWKAAGTKPGGVPHSVFQLANHMIYWQEWVVKWLDGAKARPPKHAAGGWPGAVGPVNSYHAGQVAMLRQMLGAWPPPSGGVTW